LRFRELLNEDYPDGFWIEKQYRAAVLGLETHSALAVQRQRHTASGRPPRGVQLDDMLTFPAVTK
jgi:hypothetical protein